ncbi:outer membrane protein [Puniceibacterium sediminis]|uniref:Opacity protein n=1 Tax=Puniceibacterium sediminis TaxID=1608407 RepID=A0A238UTR7_9RHOB|nr:outer membrane beta-barrel protein [Puniceibacterium sediminis]SNR25512.1 Opacity protein [Puniceibacterium sediminis]
MKIRKLTLTAAALALSQYATAAGANGLTPVVENPAIALPTPASAAGPYVRGALGKARSEAQNAYWEPPGFPGDPRVHFNMDVDDASFVEAAIGYDFANGFRGDLAFSGFGEADFDGDWSHTNPTTPGPHADMSGSIKSRAMMLNGYFEPLAYMGRHESFQPFLTAGIGMARNEMSDWTRTNATSTPVSRTFEGDTNTGFAWSVGFGVSAELNTGGRPVFLEASYRYFDLGTASGSIRPCRAAARPALSRHWSSISAIT